MLEINGKRALLKRSVFSSRGDTLELVTQKMQYHESGPCWCIIYRDGAIEYFGRKFWQRRAKISSPTFPQEYRQYKSQLEEADYIAAMNILSQGENEE